MPNYTYQCIECLHEVEETLVPIEKRDDPRTCPECRSKMTRVFDTKRVGGFVTDTKKLPNGDLVSRTRPINNSNTWDRNPTKRWK